MEKQKFIEGSMKEGAYLLHHKLNHLGLNAGDSDRLLQAVTEGVGLWVDVDARDRLSVDVDCASLFWKYCLRFFVS
jgi:hypothetical protein